MKENSFGMQLHLEGDSKIVPDSPSGKDVVVRDFEPEVAPQASSV